MEAAVLFAWPGYDFKIFDAPDEKACLVSDNAIVPGWLTRG